MNENLDSEVNEDNIFFAISNEGGDFVFTSETLGSSRKRSKYYSLTVEGSETIKLGSSRAKVDALIQLVKNFGEYIDVEKFYENSLHTKKATVYALRGGLNKSLAPINLVVQANELRLRICSKVTEI